MSTAAAIILVASLVVLGFTFLKTKWNDWRMTKTLGVILAVSYFVVLAVAFFAEAHYG